MNPTSLVAALGWCLAAYIAPAPSQAAHPQPSPAAQARTSPAAQAHTSPAGQIPAELATRIDTVVAEWLARSDAPSVSLAIVQNGTLAYTKAYGHARLRPKVPADMTTRYAIDSLTKQFTASAILLLVEQGKVSLDQPLQQWLPDLGPAANVTLRQVLTHTSGIRDYWPQDFVTPEMTRPTRPEAIVSEWANRPLDFEPGTDWQYSNTGYVLAAQVIERVAGMGYLDFVRQRLFLPLGMTRVVDGADPQTSADAAGYTRHGLGPVRAAAKEASGWLFGAANLVMDASDLARWDLSLIDRTLLSAPSYDAQRTPVTLKDGTRRPYGLGLDVEQIEGRLRIGHSGGGSGFLADNRVWPAERMAIVVLTNNDWASPADLSSRIAFLLLKPPAAQMRARNVFAALQQGAIDRTLFSDVGNFYLTAEVLGDLRASLQEAGPARDIQLEYESKRGGMTTRHWKILCRNARFEVLERGTADRLDEFLITQRED